MVIFCSAVFSTKNNAHPIISFYLDINFDGIVFVVLCIVCLFLLSFVNRHTYFFLENIILYILRGISPFKMHKIIFFPRKPEKILGFNIKFRQCWVTLNTGIFLFGRMLNGSETFRYQI